MLEKGEGTRNSSWDIVIKTTGAFNFVNTIKKDVRLPKKTKRVSSWIS